jgi:hypothetical protein
LAVARRRTREAIAAAALFAVVTVVAALVPQSHELRYYMLDDAPRVARPRPLGARPPLLTGLVATSALAIVAWSTDAGYLYPSGSTIDELVTARVDRRTIDAARPGQRLCVARWPFTILYAPLFHARKDYAVQEAAAEADCARSP